MKYETVMLQSLFAACMLVCVLVFGAMLTTTTPVPALATTHAAATTPVNHAS